ETAALAGWFPVVETERPADTPLTVNDTWEVVLVDGTPTRIWIERAKTDDEIAAEAEQNARLTNLEQRIAMLEAVVFPAPADPTTPTDPGVKTFEEHGGVWPAGGLLREQDVVFRNVAGMPLTTPPSLFPGGIDQWTHLFVVVLGEVIIDPPDPDRPAGYVGTWDAATTYNVGDVVDRNEQYYKCLIKHGSEYGGTWGPPA